MSPLINQYKYEHKYFQLAVLYSLIVHVLIIFGMFFISNKMGHPKFLTGPVYTVNLVDMPSHGTPGPTIMAPPTGGSIAVPTPLTPPKPTAKDLNIPKIKKANDIPVIKPSITEPKINSAPVIKPVIQPGVSNKQNPPGGQMLGAVKGNNITNGAALPGVPSTGSVGSNIPGAIPFPDPYYLQILQTKITGNWIPPKGIVSRQKELSLMVYFTIDRQGKLTQLQVEESSGSGLLDQSGMRAVQLSSPLPPLPSVVKEDLLNVHFRFTYAP